MVATYVCPKGDQSDDAEFCSVCGIKMELDGGGKLTDPSVERCPSCGIERKSGARFCETCRYDFKSQSAAIPAPVEPQSTPAEAPSDPVVLPVVAPPATTTVARYWEALVSVDPALDVEPDPETPCPTGTPERSFPLDLPENLIGRRSAARGILPSITVNDPGVSHRHLMVYRNPDASLMISDLGSSNGTFLNGSDTRLEPGVKTRVADGDRIELGRWTRISFRSRD
jgi:FHA domain